MCERQHKTSAANKTKQKSYCGIKTSFLWKSLQKLTGHFYCNSASHLKYYIYKMCGYCVFRIKIHLLYPIQRQNKCDIARMYYSVLQLMFIDRLSNCAAAVASIQ